MRMEFSSITISYFVHSTEDADRLNQSLCSSLRLEPEEIATEKLEGHYGNELIFAKAHVTGKRAQSLVRTILDNLDESAKSRLLSELGKSVDEHDALYLRIDRQSVGQRLSLTDEEPVRIKLKPKFRAGGRELMIRAYRDLIG